MEKPCGCAVVEKRARATRIRERIEVAQAKMRDELAKAGQPPPSGEAPELHETLGQRYILFRKAAEEIVRQRAPKATVVLDRVGYADAMMELSQDGAVVGNMLYAALSIGGSVRLLGAELAATLCRELHLKLGRRASGIVE